MGSANKGLILSMVAVAALAVGFWMLLLSPKREEAAKLSEQVAQARESLSLHRSEVEIALQARREFPVAYQQLVVLGKAVPAEDETPSLLVQLNRIAHNAKVRFQGFTLNSAGGGEEEALAPPAEGVEVSPTEAAASLLPLGATIGPAGLGVMPYTLSFKGDFFHLADFIRGLDKLVKTQNSEVSVNGRLITIDGFSLAPDSESGFPKLEATFEITAFVTPPSAAGVTGEATPEGPAPATATPAATTTGGTP